MTDWLGLIRSLFLYWRPGRQSGLRRMYEPFVRPGDLVFDVGAHLGDRTAAFAALGARVVALEPQPQLLPWLRRLAGRSDQVWVRGQAVGRSTGTASLAVSRLTPTVSTLAESWPERLSGVQSGIATLHWDRTVEVTVTTLDTLIAEFGVPDFCKLDVEGYEAEALAGLSKPLGALSVEFVSWGLEVAIACVQRLEELADYEYNAVFGEGRAFAFLEWLSPEQITDWLEAGADSVTCGDIYARRRGVEEPA